MPTARKPSNPPRKGFSTSAKSPSESSVPFGSVDLDWYAENDTVTVTPRNQQRFEIQKDQAIEILRMAHRQQKLFGKQFQLLLETLAAWIGPRREKIQDAIVTLQDARLAFVVVRNSVPYDEEFEESLAELDLRISQDPDLSLVRLTATCLPRVSTDALMSFVDQRLLLRFESERKRRGTRK